jgi:hypothetical protein
MVNRQPDRAVASNSWAWDAPDEVDAAIIDIDLDASPRYSTHRSRPGAQLIARVALWGAVAFGCLSGLVALARPPAAPPAAPLAVSSGVELPAPVAGAAERVVAAWLTATNDDQTDLAALFVDQVRLSSRGLEPLVVGTVTTVAGHEVSAGYWSVTVAADVTETPGPGATGGTAIDGDGSDGTADAGLAGDPLAEAPATTTWYVEVGIVGDVESGLAALTTPAVLPAAPPGPEGWRRDDRGVPLVEDDEQYATVEGFLRALLMGQGDPSRYMAPGQSIETPAHAPFVGVEIQGMTMAGVPEDGRVQVWVEADVETEGGVHRLVAYQIDMAEREDRWEVAAVSGVPTTVIRSDEAESAPTTTESLPPPLEGVGNGEVDAPASDGADGDAVEQEAPPDVDGAGLGRGSATTVAP